MFKTVSNFENKGYHICLALGKPRIHRLGLLLCRREENFLPQGPYFKVSVLTCEFNTETGETKFWKRSNFWTNVNSRSFRHVVSVLEMSVKGAKIPLESALLMFKQQQ